MPKNVVTSYSQGLTATEVSPWWLQIQKAVCNSEYNWIKKGGVIKYAQYANLPSFTFLIGAEKRFFWAQV